MCPVAGRRISFDKAKPAPPLERPVNVEEYVLDGDISDDEYKLPKAKEPRLEDSGRRGGSGPTW